MTEAIREFAVGEEVVSLCSLTSTPTKENPIRVELPSGSRGTVNRVRIFHCERPYVVMFEVGDGALVEISAAEHQLGRIRPISTNELPPLEVREPVRRINRAALHQPSVAHPHYRCKLLHAVQVIHWLGFYGLALVAVPFPAIITAVCIVLAAYLHQLTNYGEWALVPYAFRREQAEAGQRLVVYREFVDMAYAADVALTGVLTAFFVYHFWNIVNQHNPSPLPYVVLASMVFIAWMTKSITHSRAVRIEYMYGD